ncbi:MAG: hypothetical protein ACREDK_01495 [Thermoplasmata archaeon]
MTGRETAFRVLASELNHPVREEKGTGERAAHFVVSALGTRMNRALVVGRLAPAEAASHDPEVAFLRARLDDPTGTVTVTSGSFQPRALEQMRRITEPTWCLVVGKVHLFEARDGTRLVSVRAESLRPLEEPEARAFLGEAALVTWDRLNPPQKDAPVVEAPSAAAGGTVSGALYREILDGLDQCRRAIEGPSLNGSTGVPPVGPRKTEAPHGPAVTITRLPPPPVERVPSAAERAHESALLDLLDEITEGALDGYADLRDLVARAATLGISSQRAEELVNRLEEAGAVEEPIVGKLRRA